MFEYDVVASACELFKEYGVEPGQLAVVVASVALLFGGKISARLGTMAIGHLWSGFTTCLKWAFSAKPEPEASPALRAALEALKDDTAMYDPRDRSLHCTGLRVQLHAQTDNVAEAMAAPQQLKGGQWIGQRIRSLLGEGEWAKLTVIALDKIGEVIERDRVAANREAAYAIGSLVVDVPPDCVTGCVCHAAGKKTK